MGCKTLNVLEFNKILDIIADYSATAQAREQILCIKPISCIQNVRDMLNYVDEAMQMIITKGFPHFDGMHDIRESLKRLEAGGILNPGELLSIGDVLRGCRSLLEYINDKNDSGRYPKMVQLINKLVPNIRIEQKIFSCIINEEEISDTATAALFNIRRQIITSQDAIKQKLDDIVRSQKYIKYLQEPIVTLREGRYVVPVKTEHKNEINGIVHDTSSTGSTLYIEPLPVVESNNNIKQLKLKEKREIEKILQELSAEVVSIIDVLIENIQVITQADVIFSKAKFGIGYNCSIPEVNSDGYINIIKGRHPLIDNEKVVPIDIWLGDKFRTLVITGPNTGGKTVTLKTVGLFTLMMQAGIPVPAGEATKLSMFNDVFADIGDEQSIQQNLSTFSSHMTNIVNILNKVSADCLVLFDEIGAGTDPAEGSALAISILEYIRNIGACTIATTHYSDLKLYAMQTESVENACCEFDLDSLKPTYRLLVGIPGKSNAIDISARIGLNREIINSARNLISNDILRFEDILSDIQIKNKIIEEEKLRTLMHAKQIQDLKYKLEQEKAGLEQKKNQIITEAKKDARDIILSAKNQTDEIINMARKALEQSSESERMKILEAERRQLNDIIGNFDVAPYDGAIQTGDYPTRAEDLKPGTSVYVKSINSNGIVINLPDNEDVMVQTGAVKIKCRINDVTIIKKQCDNEIHVQGTATMNISKSKNISTQIDLRGQILDDAILSVDKYIDDVALSGIKLITIIHGKGTGTLRKGIHQYLKTNSHVESYRIGRYGEGEDGVTVVQLK